MQTIEEHAMTPPGYDPKAKTCLKCNHHDVCQVYKYAIRFIGQEYPDGDGPFKPEDTAKICQFYNPLKLQTTDEAIKAL